MMRIIKATIDYSKEISKLMLSDLKSPNSKFPQEMINNFREHAKEENIVEEFNNPNLIAFLAIRNNELVGFIVGYKKDLSSVMIQYIVGKSIKTKKLLLTEFVDKCKEKKILHIKTDTFEFMENNNLFKQEGFILTKKEKITDNLEVLWYKLNVE